MNITKLCGYWCRGMMLILICVTAWFLVTTHGGRLFLAVILGLALFILLPLGIGYFVFHDPIDDYF